MLSFALIERRIKELTRGEHTDETVKEFALTCLARDYLLATITEQEKGEKAAGKPRIILTNYCADLNYVPNVEEIEKAITAAAYKSQSREERERLAVSQTWAQIIGGKN